MTRIQIKILQICIAGLAVFPTLASGAMSGQPTHFLLQGPTGDLRPIAAATTWRSGGSTSFLSSRAKFDGLKPIGTSLWVALESYPSDLELTVERLNRSSFVGQAKNGDGFDIWIDTFGRWGAWIETEDERIELRADKLFPLYEWAQIGFCYDPRSGDASLILNGEAIARRAVKPGTSWVPADTELLVARPAEPAAMLNFTVNMLNGAFRDVVVSQDLDPLQRPASTISTTLPSIEEALAVPAERFQNDHLRPRYHAIPPANWTNEPHGLVLLDGRYHLFYQRTPNGPFKTQMVWGHMSSADLVNWTYHRDALRPSLQTDSFGFDMKGIWSGDVIIDGDTAYAYYTSVNHGPSEAYNPGISVATSTDPLLRSWQKRGPIIDTTFVRDFRDPYLWQEDDESWHMIIGAALKSGGGLDYYRCSRETGPSCWEHVRRFTSVPYARMDVGSEIWEMPVFEEIEGRRLLIVNPIGGKVSKYGNPATRSVYWLGRWQDGRFAPDDLDPALLDLFPGHLSPTVARQESGSLAGIGIVDERRTPQAQENAGWAHTFSLPREYYINKGNVLGQRPLKALEGLRRKAQRFGVEAASPDKIVDFEGAHQLELTISFNGDGTGPFGIRMLRSPDGGEETRLVYDPWQRTFTLDKSKSSSSGEDEGPLVLHAAYDDALYGQPRDWRVFIDGSVIDVFIGDGAAFSFRSYPSDPKATGIAIERNEGTAAEGAIWQLAPASFDYDFSALDAQN